MLSLKSLAILEAKYLAIIGVFLLIERLHPIEKNQSRRSLWLNLLWIPYIGILNVVFPPLVTGGLIHHLQSLVGKPWVVFAPSSNWGIELLKWLGYILILDFGFYWNHRLQHTKWFWPSHMLHHSERALNVTTTELNHWFEGPMMALIIFFPANTFFDFNMSHPASMFMVIQLWRSFVHLNFRLHLGPLAYVFGGPQGHRLHHSIEEKHFARNYYGFFPIFDILFGTFYYPLKDEFPATGLKDMYLKRSFFAMNFDPCIRLLELSGMSTPQSKIGQSFSISSGS